jgi:hypothetical protein
VQTLRPGHIEAGRQRDLVEEEDDGGMRLGFQSGDHGLGISLSLDLLFGEGAATTAGYAQLGRRGTGGQGANTQGNEKDKARWRSTT